MNSIRAGVIAPVRCSRRSDVEIEDRQPMEENGVYYSSRPFSPLIEFADFLGLGDDDAECKEVTAVELSMEKGMRTAVRLIGTFFELVAVLIMTLYGK